ncbi:MAG: hypothetical protein GY925_26300 [Actinomycetia bacterium]|nr:hypothetical protein [Actinomycetes bacterium]
MMARIVAGVACMAVMTATVAAGLGVGYLGWTAPGRYPDQLIFAALIVAGVVVVEFWAVIVFAAVGWTLIVELILNQEGPQ